MAPIKDIVHVKPELAPIKDVAAFFRLPGETLRAFTDEWQALPEESRVHLRAGIANGSLTY